MLAHVPRYSLYISVHFRIASSGVEAHVRVHVTWMCMQTSLCVHISNQQCTRLS